MNIDPTHYVTVKPKQIRYRLVLVVLSVLVVTGGYSAYQMEHSGHHITGMNNQVVWGLPHVFAITLIVAASGALNAASFSSVFGAHVYKPYARLSVVMAMCLLVGGLVILVLDLGRPDRLIIALTHFNFRSIFSWNIFLYTGFLVLGTVYLWMMMEKRFNRHVSKAGALVFSWRLVLTTGTGCIFGFLVGRNALDTALMAPLFVAVSLVLGTALFVLVWVLVKCWHTGWDSAVLPVLLSGSLRKLLLWFILSVFYLSVVHHLTNLYVSEHLTVERYTLLGPQSLLFWIGHVGIGVVMPVFLLLSAQPANYHRRLVGASYASIFGCIVLLYVIIIGSQSTPQVLFPGKTVLASRFGDASNAVYIPSLWEWSLGAGGVAFAALLFLLSLRILPFTPDRLLSDRRMDDAKTGLE